MNQWLGWAVDQRMFYLENGLSQEMLCVLLRVKRWLEFKELGEAENLNQSLLNKQCVQND